CVFVFLLFCLGFLPFGSDFYPLFPALLSYDFEILAYDFEFPAYDLDLPSSRLAFSVCGFDFPLNDLYYSEKYPYGLINRIGSFLTFPFVLCNWFDSFLAFPFGL